MSISRRALLGAAAASTLPIPAIARGSETLRVGLSPQQPTQEETRRVWEPLYRAVADRLGMDVTLTVANDWAGISTAISNEQIDIAQMGPWGYILAHVNSGARIVSVMQINGKPTYKAIIVARPGLTVTNFPEGARGMSMQMLDRGSTSGWLVPTHFLRSHGITDLQSFFGRYAEGASAAAAQMATINGQVDLATGWDTHRNTMIHENLMKEDANKVIWESEPLPNEPIVVRKGMDEKLAAGLGQAFASLTKDQLKSMPWPYTGFVAGTHDAYSGLEQMGHDLGVLKG
jgi:phosphonate transport system substrate-binding protein